MPGFGIEDDELKKLFAEAEGAVKKATTRPATPVTLETPAEPAPPPDPAPFAAAPQPPPSAPAAPPPPQPPVQMQAPPLPAMVERPAPTPPPAMTGSEPLRLMGGEQDADALNVRTQNGQTLRLPWNSLRALTLGRVQERQWLAFVSGSGRYYFVDDNVAYKGLLRSLQTTTSANWRGLVTEIAAQVADATDPGVSVFTGAGGGTIPKFLDRPSFWAAVAAKS